MKAHMHTAMTVTTEIPTHVRLIRIDVLVSYLRTVSAPGKVLVAGGYLVLDRPNVGVVLAATARFYTSVKWTDEQVRTLQVNTPYPR